MEEQEERKYRRLANYLKLALVGLIGVIAVCTYNACNNMMLSLERRNQEYKRLISEREAQQNAPLSTEQLPETIRKSLKIHGLEEKVEIPVARDDYLCYRNEPRNAFSQRDATKYVVDHPIIKKIAEQIFASGGKQGTVWEYENALHFLRNNIRYEEDPGKGYLKHPLETIVEESGDCEDHTALLASIMQYTQRKMGIVFEEKHVVLAIELRKGEKVPLMYEITMDPGDMIKLLEKYRDTGKTIDEVFKLEAEALKDNIGTRTTATVEHEGRRYFIVESTEKNSIIAGMKPLLEQVGKFIPLN